jgi:hypothetical protein
MDLVEAQWSFGKSLVNIIIHLSLTYVRVHQMGDILTKVLVGYPQANTEVQGLKKSLYISDHTR